MCDLVQQKDLENRDNEWSDNEEKKSVKTLEPFVAILFLLSYAQENSDKGEQMTNCSKKYSLVLSHEHNEQFFFPVAMLHLQIAHGATFSLQT